MHVTVSSMVSTFVAFVREAFNVTIGAVFRTVMEMVESEAAPSSSTARSVTGMLPS